MQFIDCLYLLQASRKTRYPEDFGWNLQSFVTVLLTHIREKHSDLSAKVGEEEGVSGRERNGSEE